MTDWRDSGKWSGGEINQFLGFSNSSREEEGWDSAFLFGLPKVNNISHKDFIHYLESVQPSTLSGLQWFSTLDLLSGCWQVEVEDADRDKTAFCTT